MTATTNNLSIEYRLLAARLARQGLLNESATYTERSLAIYRRRLLDKTSPVTQRNLAHAYLYAGKIPEAVSLLTRSLLSQTEPSVIGDEYCHLAAAFLSTDDTTFAESLLNRGSRLITESGHQGVHQVFALMTQASLWEKKGLREEAQELISRAFMISLRNGLVIRAEELIYLILHQEEGIDVLKAVAGRY